MLNLVYHQQFRKHYKKRIQPNLKLRSRFEERLKLWIVNKNDPILKDHSLSGDKAEYRAFWITGNIRVTYKIYDKDVELYDVGTHNQVY
ncbi:MAG: type II toxin-antitoxin system YafQ family toxin [Patescibacteria group bacterium]